MKNLPSASISKRIVTSILLASVCSLHALTLSNDVLNNGNHSSITWRLTDLYKTADSIPATDGETSGSFTASDLLYFKESVTFDLAALAGWHTDAATLAVNDFETYLNGLDGAEIVSLNNTGELGVDSPTGYPDSEFRLISDTHEAIVITVDLSELADTTTCTLQSIKFGSYHASNSDRTDFVIYDKSEDALVEAQWNVNYDGDDSVSGSWVLEDGDKIIIAAGKDNNQGFRFESMTFDLTSTLTESPNPSEIPDSLDGVKSYTYTGFVGVDYEGNVYPGEVHNIEVHSPDGHYQGDNKPVYVFFHGGAWGSGNLTQGRPWCEYLSSRGMVGITAEYTLPGNKHKEICIMDAKTVIRWVREHAYELGIDPNRVVAGGYSAGAHISILQGLNEDDTNPNDDLSIPTALQGIMVICPAISWLGQDTTPLESVNAFSYVDQPFPPTLMLVGQTDSWEDKSDDLAQELLQQGREIEVWMAMGVGHELRGYGPAQTPMKLQMDAFLRKLGYLEGEPTLTPDGDDIELEHHRGLPEVSITEPNSDVISLVNGYSSFVLEVDAQNPDKDGDESGAVSGVKQVEVFLDDVLIHTDTEAPFFWNESTLPELLGLAPGEYSLKVVATDYEDGIREDSLAIKALTQTFANWEASYGISGDKAGPYGDYDDDGLNNIYEYFFGLNPTDIANPRRPVSTFLNDGVHFSYTYRTDAPITYTVQFSDDLINWTTHETVLELDDTSNADGTSTREISLDFDPELGSKQFFRILVQN